MSALCEIYRPTEPYRFKDGKHVGKIMECLMFTGIFFLHDEYDLIHGKMKNGSIKNEFHDHLEWLLRQGENRRTKILCPYCRDNYITQIAVISNGDGSCIMNLNDVACDNRGCELAVEFRCIKDPNWVPLKFSSITKKFSTPKKRFKPSGPKKSFKLSENQKRFVGLLKEAYGFGKGQPGTPKRAFAFFSE